MEKHGSRDGTLEQMFRCYGDDVLRFCAACLGDRAQGEDAAQEVFIKAWRSIERFHAAWQGAEKAWLMRIAVNTCRDYQRSSWFRHVDRRWTPEHLPESTWALPDEERELMMDVMNLEGKYRQVILMCHLHGMTQKDAAKALGISRTAVAKRLKRAYTLLKVQTEGGAEDAE